MLFRSIACIVDSFDFRDLRTMNTIDEYAATHYVELAFDDTGNYVLKNGVPYYTMLFDRFHLIEDYINEVGTAIKQKLIRDSAAEFSVDLPIPRLYKQTFAGDGTKGTLIAKEDLWILTFIMYDATPIGGLFLPEDKHSIPGLYQSVYDFLSEYYESNLQKAWSSDMVDSIANTAIFGVYINEVDIELDIESFEEWTLTRRAKRLKTVTSSMNESRSGGDFSDIDNYEARIASTRNKEEWTIPIIFNNIPTSMNYIRNVDLPPSDRKSVV